MHLVQVLGSTGVCTLFGQAGGVGSTASRSSDGNSSTEHHNSTSIRRTSGFVWAMQIAEVRQDVLHRDRECGKLWDKKAEGTIFAHES